MTSRLLTNINSSRFAKADDIWIILEFLSKFQLEKQLTWSVLNKKYHFSIGQMQMVSQKKTGQFLDEVFIVVVFGCFDFDLGYLFNDKINQHYPSALSPYLSALDFCNSPVWNIQFDELHLKSVNL